MVASPGVVCRGLIEARRLRTNPRKAPLWAPRVARLHACFRIRFRKPEGANCPNARQPNLTRFHLPPSPEAARRRSPGSPRAPGRSQLVRAVVQALADPQRNAETRNLLRRRFGAGS